MKKILLVSVLFILVGCSYETSEQKANNIVKLKENCKGEFTLTVIYNGNTSSVTASCKENKDEN